MKFGELIAIIAAVLGLAGALEGFINVAFSTKLVALVLVGVLVFGIVARRLADWLRVKSTPRIGPQSRRRSKAKIVVAIIVLGSLGGCLFFAAYVVVKYYAINVEQATASSNQSGLWITGARQVATKLTVLVPPRKDFECQPVGERDHPAQTIIVAWDTQTPHLQITNFKYSERQGVMCSPAPGLDRFSFLVEPATLEIVLPEQRRNYHKIFFSVGGVLWIASIVFVISRSR